MARCFCRWRRVLICICTPCISLALLFVYVTVMLCMAMNDTSVPGIPVQDQQGAHFVASGSFRNKSFAPLPKTFWDLHQQDAYWNRLQLTIDRHFNPILQANNSMLRFKNSTFYESLVNRGFPEVTNLSSMKRNIEQLPQLLKDFASSMHRRDYPILIQPDGVCGVGAKDETEPPLLLLAIKSTEMNFKNRQVIRQTWGQAGWVAGQKINSSEVGGKQGGFVRRVFLLATENTEELGVDLNYLLEIESKQYGDILKWDFKDTFFNLTLKDVLFWKWFSHSCSRVRFVFKGDDDVFVHTPKIITYLQDQLKTPQAYKTMKNFMVGNVIEAAIPIRVNTSKYFIPDSFYKGLYPSYPGGGGVVYSGLLAKRLYTMSKRVNLYPIDDVYVGMCMIRLNAHPIHHPAFLTFDFPDKEEEGRCSYHTVLLVHKRSPDQLVQLWAHLRETQEQCKDVPLRKDKEPKL
ncbi:N-acetyllactosaminide beta-1,3-N-acetylglucosaminyltransferase 2 [Epinephelus fuscoguttatus]|uniref:N-acetyllactosaminide beta-1,3-N-acetylglucosaminyltransferase 2 n=1 Tax=Epinephelus fuscoguttatus TaxID=293821 RepID=UPI0020D0EA29|nr:N-acetyllactosaminide beta-1,3-N-acetylglucosaminyltransferase 2 [Epinephelus fuscoguttatus]